MRMRLIRLVTGSLLIATLAAPVAADEMQDAMDRADALNLMRRLNVQPDQARAMIDPLETIQDIVEDYRAGQEQNLNRIKGTLERARGQLIAGRQLSENMEAMLQEHRTQRLNARRTVYRSVDEQMQRIADVLTSEQNQSLDWTAPGSISPQERMEERLRVQRMAMGRIQEAAQMLDRVKQLDAFNFVTGRGPIINDYLSLYYQPGSQQFQQAFDIVLQYTNQVRMMDQQQWQAQALDIGAGLVRDLDLLPKMDVGASSGTMSWSRLFSLLTDKQTLEVVRDLAE